MYKRLLIPTDGSPLSDQAASYGLGLAQALGAQVGFIHVLDDTALLSFEGFNQTQLQHDQQKAGEEILLKAKVASNKQGFEATTLLRRGRPAQEITNELANYDLLVIGTHGRSGVGRWLLGSVAQEVLHHTSKPVMLVRSGQPWQAPRSILLPTDGSTWSVAVIQQGLQLAKALGCEVFFVYVMDSAPYTTIAEAAVYYVQLQQDLQASANEALDQATALARDFGVVATAQALHGYPPKQIALLAQSHDLLVMGAHGRGFFDRLVLGSVTQRVAQLTSKPLLILHEPAAHQAQP